MKKTLELIQNYDANRFIPKFDIGVDYPPSTMKFQRTTNLIYTINSDSAYKLSIGYDGDQVIARDDGGSFYRVYDGIQNAMFLLISDLSKKSHF